MTRSLPESVRDAVAAVVKLATGLGPAAVEVVRSDADYWIVSVGTTSGDQLIVKLASSILVPSLEAAKAKHDLIRQAAGIPMAEMIAADDSATIIPLRYSIQTQLVGEEWATRRGRLCETERDRALANLGDVVGRLHQPRLPAFGALTAGRERHCLPALAVHARRLIRDDALGARFVDLLERNGELWAGAIQPGITHDDLHGFNILFHPDRPTEVSGILDFDKAWSGPCESDLARMELWRGMTSPTFLAAYRQRIPELPGYPDRRPFYQLIWYLEFAQNTPEHLETTNGLLERLRLRPIGAFS